VNSNSNDYSTYCWSLSGYSTYLRRSGWSSSDYLTVRKMNYETRIYCWSSSAMSFEKKMSCEKKNGYLSDSMKMSGSKMSETKISKMRTSSGRIP
jgi:hypothetical protein